MPLAGFLGLLGLRTKAPRGIVGMILVVGAVVTAGVALYLMFGPPADDQAFDLVAVAPANAPRNPFDVSARASLGIGGFVTVAGASLLGVAGVVLTAAKER